MTKSIKTIDDSQGLKLNIAGGEYRIIVSGKDTNGAYAIIEMTVPIGAGPVPHSHPDFDEVFYVVEGELTFKSENGTYIAQKGATVSIPTGGIIHNFKNNSNKIAKLLCTVIPAGLDACFIEVNELINSNTNIDLDVKAAIQSISEKYGQKLYRPDFWD